MVLRTASPEQVLQARIVAALRAVLRPPAMVVAYPAGGGGRVRGAILHGMGLLAGLPDLFLFHAGRAWGLEVKTARGRLSPAQRDCHVALEQAGVPTAVVRSVDDALAQVLRWCLPVRLSAADRDRYGRFGL